jgi:hypothetical protein
MTLFELLFFIGIMAIASIAGFLGYSYGGFWMAGGCTLGAIVISVGMIHLASTLGTMLHRSNLKCPCGACRDDDYVWIGQDSQNNPIAKYTCGKTVVLIDRNVKEVKPM